MKWYLIFSICLLIILFSLISCRSNKSSQKTKNYQTQIKTTRSSIEGYFSDNDSLEVIPNNQGNLILYLKKDTLSKAEPVVNINFIVYDKKKDKIIYTNNYTRASINWFNNTQLLLTRNLGIIDKQNGKSRKHYLINVKTSEMKEYIKKNQSINL